MNIMIVEPSEVSRAVIENTLMKLGVKSGDINLFVDGEDAMAFAREEGADLLFTVLNLPGMDGIDFIDIILKLIADDAI